MRLLRGSATRGLADKLEGAEVDVSRRTGAYTSEDV